MRGAAAIRVPQIRIAAVVLIAVVALAAGCGRPGPPTGVTPIKVKNLAELQLFLLTNRPDVALFRLRGPFEVEERTDLEFPLAPGRVVSADLFVCERCAKAPLVVVLHGHGNTKNDHAWQAMHLASWGMHGLTVQLPNHGPWIANGKTLATLITAIRRTPEIVDSRIDPTKIVLVGHSFGATAVAAALGEGAPALAGILLDPAGIGRELPELLKRIKVPVMLIGADEDIWPTRNRGYFFRFVPGAIGELSIRDAVHEDAQYPSEYTPRAFNDNPLATEEAQITFVSALTAAAFGLSATGGIDYAWRSFEDAFTKGSFFNARRK